MNSKHSTLIIVVVVVVVAAAAVLLATLIGASSSSTAAPSLSGEAATSTDTQTPPSGNAIQATFDCDNGKSIDATFINSTTSTTTGNYVQLSLSDGRQLTLPEVISADGGRYANADQSFVFWNVGNGATIWENGTTTFTNCITQG